MSRAVARCRAGMRCDCAACARRRGMRLLPGDWFAILTIAGIATGIALGALCGWLAGAPGPLAVLGLS